MSPAHQKSLADPDATRAAAWFLDNSPQAFVTLRNGAVRWVNGTWTAATGWTSAQTLDHPYARFVHGDDQAAVNAELEALAPGSRTVFACRLAARSRGFLWVRHMVARAEDGSCQMILRDITIERQREADNEEARRVMAMVRTAAGVNVCRYDAETQSFEVDPDFTNHPDHNASRRMTQSSALSSVHPEDVPRVHPLWRHSVETGEPGAADFRTPSDVPGEWRHLRLTWQGAQRRSNGLYDLLCIAQDITEITEARDAAVRGEASAKAAGETKTLFLANISHEVRTPMNGVLGLLHLLKSDPPRTERRSLVEQALAAGHGLSDLLNDIIDFADVEAGRLELACEPVDPIEQLQSVAAMFRPQIEAKHLRLNLETALDIGWVAADPARMRKILFHLIGNAVKFTNAGRIDVRLSAFGEGEARRVRMEVADTGVGIAPQAKEGLFEKFNQGDSSLTRRYGGPGLGLAVSKRLAEQMDGSVGFDSELGKGSTFWVEISAPSAVAPDKTQDADDQDWLAGVRVLIVEDNATNRLVATKMLRAMGAEVVTAENGLMGVTAMETQQFDLVFMDIQMPVMDGVEATRRIRSLPGAKGAVPIVATTANVLPQQLDDYRRSGINGVVAKPISPAALLAEVARVAAETEAA